MAILVFGNVYLGEKTMKKSKKLITIVVRTVVPLMG